MYHLASLDEMFPRAQPVMHPPLPQLKNPQTYALIQQNANKLGLKLTPAHDAVIEFILDFYEHCDDCENARALADLIQQEFTAQGGRKYLYRLFPDGPVSTIHKLADLPTLRHQTDSSFGTRF